MKKLRALVTAMFVMFFAGCASTPPPPPIFLGIADARRLEGETPESSQYAVVVRYEDVEPGKYELKIGFGYNPTDENLQAMVAGSLGLYAIAYSEVLQQSSGDIRVTLEPRVVQNLGGTLNGRIHAILAPYPHGREWKVAKQDIFVLP